MRQEGEAVYAHVAGVWTPEGADIPSGCHGDGIPLVLFKWLLRMEPGILDRQIIDSINSCSIT